MQTQQIQQTAQQVQQQEISGQPANNQPEKKFRAGALSISVWKNATLKDGKAVEYRTVSLGRSYKKNGVWQNSTASLRVHDLPKIAVMLNEAYKFLIMQTRENVSGGDEALVM